MPIWNATFIRGGIGRMFVWVRCGVVWLAWFDVHAGFDQFQACLVWEYSHRIHRMHLYLHLVFSLHGKCRSI